MVLAPQTLFDADRKLPPITAANVICHLGECGLQYALDPIPKEYCGTEVFFSVRSLELKFSTLASKATGYPPALIVIEPGPNVPCTGLKTRQPESQQPTYANLTAKKDLVENVDNEFTNPADKSITTIVAAFCHGFADEKTRGGRTSTPQRPRRCH